MLGCLTFFQRSLFIFKKSFLLFILDNFCPYVFMFTIFFFLTLGSFIYLFLWLCWVFVSVWGLSLVVASGGHSSSRCVGLSLSRPLLLRSTGSRHAGSVIVAHGPSCSAACRIFPDQGSNPCPLHWQADSQPLHHQGSPMFTIFVAFFISRCSTWVFFLFLLFLLSLYSCFSLYSWAHGAYF